MKIDKIIFFLLPTLLFLITPFVQIYTDENKVDLFGINILPQIVNTISDFIRWIVLFIGCIVAIFIIQKGKYKISKSILFFSLFYFFQLLYAIFDANDIGRFFLLTIISLLFPLYLSVSLLKYKESLLKIFNYIIFCFIILGIFLNGHLIFSGARYLGFSNNANLFGFSALFWLLIVLINFSNITSNKKLCWINFILLTILIIFSGSRNAMVGYIVLTSFYFRNYLRQLFGSVVFMIILLLIINSYIDLSFVTDRFLNIKNSVSDSGRDEFWNKAIYYISNNLLWGNGMDANIRLIDTGNIHNVYLRFLLNMGLIFTVLCLSQLFLSIYYIIKKRNLVNYLLFAFMFSYLLINFGEDFLVGVGSSAYIFILFIYGFVNYYSISDDTSR